MYAQLMGDGTRYAITQKKRIPEHEYTAWVYVRGYGTIRYKKDLDDDDDIYLGEALRFIMSPKKNKKGHEWLVGWLVGW